jgi:hypothetical protein
MNTGEFVTDRRDKGQNGKLCSHVPARVARPIDLRISETKTVFEKVARNRRDVALPPAPVIGIRLVNQNKPYGDARIQNATNTLVARRPRRRPPLPSRKGRRLR